MKADSKIKEAVEVLANACACNDCENCPFGTGSGIYTGCILKDHSPYTWDTKLIERENKNEI